MSEPDRVTEHATIAEHEGEGLALLTEQFKGKDAAEAILTTWLAEVQTLEDVFWQLLIGCGLDNAENAQLDQIGEFLGRPRGDGMGDTPYRTVLRATALAIKSSGTGPELVEVLEILRGDDAAVLVEMQVATVRVEFTEVATIELAILLSVLARAKAAGVRLLMVTTPDAGPVFAFAEGDVTVMDDDVGLSDTGGLVGGGLAGVQEA